MAEPLESPPNGTELVSQGQLDPTLMRPSGAFIPPKPLTDGDFEPPEKDGEVGKLGRYRILKKLGQGGMGAVYLGYDVVLARRVALKVLLPQHTVEAESRERFLREARAAAMVKSDHIVTIFDVGEENNIPFIAMEYLLGYSLDQYLRVTGELPLAQILRVGREIALGLAAAHERGLVHRDVKPANIWLEAPHGRVKLLDFGLARTETDDTHLTGSGYVMGTPAFMSPEQARALKLDPRSDLFSLGVVLYRLATGRMPFTGTTTMAVLTSLAVDVPPPARQVKADIPEALEALMARLLAKNPADRYQTVWEVIKALRDIEQPRLVTGELPVVVQAIPMAIAAQSENVWEGIEASGSSPRVLESGTEATPVSADRPRKKPARKPSKWPIILTGIAFLAAIGALAGVVLWLKNPKEKESVVQNSDPTEKLRPKTPVAKPTAGDPDRKAAEYVLSVGGSVQVNNDRRELTFAAELPKEPFVLKSVNLSRKGRVTDAGLEVFRGCTTLTFLDLGTTSVSDAGVANFGGCTHLSLLSLHATNVTDAGLVTFKDCNDLTYLRLSKTRVTDAGLANFKGRTALTTLDLSGTEATDAGLMNFRGCESLIDLALSNIPVSNDGLATFSDCKNLGRLLLGNTRVTDSGLATLSKLKRLVVLDLSGTQISDEGLKHLQECGVLSILTLRGTNVTQVGLNKLRELLPLCKIEWAGGVIEPKK